MSSLRFLDLVVLDDRLEPSGGTVGVGVPVGDDCPNDEEASPGWEAPVVLESCSVDAMSAVWDGGISGAAMVAEGVSTGGVNPLRS